MAFIVTARKWRPQKFFDVAGQEHITVTLKNAIKNNRIAHAYLFTGPRGVGKTTTARIFAKALNCQNLNDAEPCNECEMCLSIQSSQSLDIIEIDAASNRGIDNIRTLRDSVKYAPTKGKYKVYIVDEVHMLTSESFNAFLKTLEEPPAHTIFIFATTDVHKVPATILSRCQRFDFRRIQLDTIKTLLRKIAETENIKIDDKTLTIIAKKADGALRDAESFFDQIVAFCGNDIESSEVAKMLNLIDDEIFFTISDAVLSKDFKSVFEATQQIYDNGWNFIDFMDGLIEHFRNIMTVILSRNTNQVETAEMYKARYMDYSGKFSEGDILRLLNFLNRTQQELKYSQNQRLKIEISLSHLIGLEKSSTINELISELKASSPIEEIKDQNNTPAGRPIGFTPMGTPTEDTRSTRTVNESSRGDYNSYNKVEDILVPSEQLNFNTVVQKWAGFVESVSAEKGLMFGPFIKELTLIGLEGNKLNVYSKDSHGKDEIRHHQDYIHQKTLEYFGKKMIFQFKENPLKVHPKGTAMEDTRGISHVEISQAQQIEKPGNKVTSTGDPYIEAIINELGGEEVT